MHTSLVGNPRQDPVLLAYLAGIVDGEGSILIEKANPGGKYPRNRYWISLIVSNTSLALMRFLDRHWSGFSLTKVTPRQEIRKDQYRWAANNLKALSVIMAIRPFLVIKGAQADLAMEFQHGVTPINAGLKMSDEEYQRRHSLYERMRTLNRKGRPQRLNDEAPVPTGEATV